MEEEQLKTRLREIATSKTDDADVLLAQLRQLQKETIEMLDETMDAVQDAGFEAEEVEGTEAAEEDSKEASNASWRVTEIKPEDVSQAGAGEEEAVAGRSPEEDDEDMLSFD